MEPSRKIGMVIFQSFTNLDMAGPYEVLSRLPNTLVILISATMEPVIADRNITILPHFDFETCPDLDVLFVPGGPGTKDAMQDETTLSFIRCQAVKATYITSVCTGSLILGAAGLLVGKRVTTHWASMDLLHLFGAIPVADRVVIDTNIISAAGVASGIDFALQLVEILEDTETAQKIQLMIEYAPQPPFNSGSVSTADPELVEAVRKMMSREEQKKIAIDIGRKLGFVEKSCV